MQGPSTPSAYMKFCSIYPADHGAIMVRAGRVSGWCSAYMLVPLLLLQVKSPMTMTEKILAKHSDNGLVVPGQVRWQELLLGLHSCVNNRSCSWWNSCSCSVVAVAVHFWQA
mgnify:CR=1 FL=1